MVGGSGRESRQSRAHGGAGAARDRGRCASHIRAIRSAQTIVKGHCGAASIGIHCAVQDCRGCSKGSRRKRGRSRHRRGHQAQIVIRTRTAGDQHEFFTRSQRAGVHRHRHIALREAVVAEFSVGVIAPGRNRAIRACRHAVKSTHRYSNYSFASQHSAGAHRHRNSALCRAVVAQLAVGIVAPSGDSAIRT